MGGLMIAEIVGRAAWLRSGEKRLILQPMTRAEELRRSLSQMGFAVLREEAVREEGHVYSAMLCAFLPERRVSDPLFPYIGGLSAGTPESRAYIRREEKRLRARAGGLRHQGENEKADGLFAVAAKLDAMLPPEQDGEEQK
jgi:tRNA (adenine22-N1)-methyltransferase